MNSDEHICNVTGGVKEGVFKFISHDCGGKSDSTGLKPLLQSIVTFSTFKGRLCRRYLTCNAAFWL